MDKPSLPLQLYPSRVTGPDLLDKQLLTEAGRQTDINQHLLTLYSLSVLSEKVVEFGVRGGSSSTALLAGQAARFRLGLVNGYIGYDINSKCAQVVERLVRQSSTTFPARFVCGSTNTMPQIAPCDMLFIDTLHTGDQVEAEIIRHGACVRKFLVFHDTVTFGLQGEAGGEGLLAGIARGLQYQQDAGIVWKLAADYQFNNGLRVYVRALN